MSFTVKDLIEALRAVDQNSVIVVLDNQGDYMVTSEIQVGFVGPGTYPRDMQDAPVGDCTRPAVRIL